MNESKQQPQSIEFEIAVLGAVILERSALINIIDLIGPEAFYLEKHRIIYKAILDLNSNSEPIDMMTICNKLKTKGELELVGGAYYVSELTNRVAAATNIEYHAKIILQNYFKREAIRQANMLIEKAYDERTDSFEIITNAVDKLGGIYNVIATDNSKTAKELTREVLLEIERKQNQTSDITGITSGFIQVDKMTGGWQKGDLIILAARPAMGKTSLATQMAINSTASGEVAYLASLEMQGVKIMSRVIASETRTNSKLLTNYPKKLDIKELNRKIGENEVIESDDLIIDDSSGITIDLFMAKIKKKNYERISRGKKPISIIFIDYLQLLYGSSQKNSRNREQEISEISRKLKSLAKELNIPIIALSQLSRSVESRADKRPMLSDLRESGSIEQDADIVIFILRPEYYGITEDANGNTTKEIAIIIIAKHRNGSIGDAVLRFENKYTRFSNIEDEETYLDSAIKRINGAKDFDETPF